jgi:DnaJ family protein C protein 2
MSLVHIPPYREWLTEYLCELGVIKRKKRPLKSKLNGSASKVNGVDKTVKGNPIRFIEDEKYLKGLDPRNWKEQDHYAVLGLKHLRINANDDDVRRAYRKMVLKHHPDKRGGVVDSDSDYFACIVKANETLSDQLKRRSYDSVDKYFDDNVPEVSKKAKATFYETFGAVFARNSRWSNVQPVPELGDVESTRDEVEHFYDFWYRFDSWREFSYLDEEDKEKGADRDERRWIEKQNKVERLKKKKAETARIRTLVDNAYACDPRIPKFKAEERERKNAKKKAAEEAKRAKVVEEERVRKETEERERVLKEQEDREAAEKKEVEKKAKANLKKNMRKEKKAVEQYLESVDFFSANGKQKLEYLEEFYNRCDKFTYEEMRDLRKGLLETEDIEMQRDLFLKSINKEVETDEQSHATLQVLKSKLQENQAPRPWPEADAQLLAKAFNLYPAGTQHRWETVCDYIKQHSTSGIERKPKDILVKVKEMQKVDPSLKTYMCKSINAKAFAPIENTFVEELVNGKEPVVNGNSNVESAWTADEQKMLEQALKNFPASTADRWDRISEQVSTRSKKECMKRYKELVELIRSKKANENSK